HTRSYGDWSSDVCSSDLSSASEIDRALQSQQDPDAKELRNPVPSTPESLAAGAQRYTKVCALCHGATGNGDGKLAAATAAYGARDRKSTRLNSSHRTISY